MSKMNEEIKAKWLKALRSGEYEQGTGYLCKDDKYCCLGVLTDLAIKDGIPLKTGEADNGSGAVQYGVEGEYPSYTVPPLSVVEWAGLRDANPDTAVTDEVYGSTLSLAGLNDGDEYAGRKGRTFAEIADIIESDF